MSEQLKVGTSLYKHIPLHGVFHYVVVGVRVYEDNAQYELECQTCNHGKKCRILTGGKSGKLVFIQLLNDEGDEQYHWHSDSTPFYYKKEHAQLERVRSHISSARSSVDEAEKTLAGRKAHYEKLMDMRAVLEKQIKELDNPKNHPQMSECEAA